LLRIGGKAEERHQEALNDKHVLLDDDSKFLIACSEHAFKVGGRLVMQVWVVPKPHVSEYGYSKHLMNVTFSGVGNNGIQNEKITKGRDLSSPYKNEFGTISDYRIGKIVESVRLYIISIRSRLPGVSDEERKAGEELRESVESYKLQILLSEIEQRKHETPEQRLYREKELARKHGYN